MDTQNQDALGRMHLLMAAVAALFCFLVLPFATPVLLGAVLAAVLSPVHVWLQRRGKMRAWVASGLTVVFFAVGLLLPFVVLLTVGIRAVMGLVSSFTGLVAQGGQPLDRALNAFPLVTSTLQVVEKYSSFSRDDLKSHLTELAQQVGLKVGGWLGSGLQQLPQGLLFIFVLLLALYFFMVDGVRLEQWVVRQSPFSQVSTTSILKRVKDTCAMTLLSTLAVSAIQSSIILLGWLITGVPGALAWFTVAFLMAFIPVMGTVPVSLGCALWLLSNGETGNAVVMLVCMALAGVSDNVVRPLVIGGAGAQHPLILLLSIFGGLSVLGFPGLFIGPVVASLFVAVLEVYTNTLRPRTVPPL